MNSIIYEPVYAEEVLNNQQIEFLFEIAKNFETSNAAIGLQEQAKFDDSIRKSSIKWLMLDKLPPDIVEYFKNVFMHINEKHFNFELSGFEHWQFTIYDEKNAGEYKWHIDTSPVGEKFIRKLSMVLMLSDSSEFVGGHLLINSDGNIQVAEQKKGRAIFFPSWVPHCVTPVLQGVRQTLVIWAHGEKFK
jgi:PKHD-type hydroxylase